MADTDGEYKLNLGKAVTSFAVASSIFHLYSMVSPIPLDSYVQRSIHLLCILVLAFLLHPINGKRLCWLDYAEVTLAATCCLYITFNYVKIQDQAGLPVGFQPIIGAVLALLILDIVRRLEGWALPIVAICSVLYALLGGHIRGVWGHSGFSMERIMAYLYTTLDGIWGIPIACSATTIVAFTILGAFLKQAGIEKAFTDLSMVAAGRLESGPAQVAVISSALFGTVSGSAVANVVATGTFTIPLMKSRGFPAYFAGAVEAAASTGGQIMPPIMGAGAFIMAEMLEMPYASICVAAMIPAFLYFLCCGLSVQFEALRLGLKTTEPGGPSAGSTLKRILLGQWYVFLPLIAMVYVISKGLSPLKAALVGTALAAVIGVAKRKDKRDILNIAGFKAALVEGSTGVVEVGVACACAGIVLGVVSMTGLGVKLTSLLIAASRGNMWLALVMAMLAAIILGMGLPTAVAYVVAAAATAPALIHMGLPPLVAHLFIFYFSILGTITPPVCLSVYTAAGLAGANWVQVALAAIRLTLPGFMIPFFAVSDNSLLMMGPWTSVLRTALTASFGVLLLAAGSIGWLRGKLGVVERVLLVGAGVALVDPGILTDVMGLLVAGGVYLRQRMSYIRPAA